MYSVNQTYSSPKGNAGNCETICRLKSLGEAKEFWESYCFTNSTQEFFDEEGYNCFYIADEDGMIQEAHDTGFFEDSFKEDSEDEKVIFDGDILLQKLNTAGIDTMVSIYGNIFKRKISNMKASSIPLEKRRNLIITKILEALVKSDDDTLSKKIIETYFAEKPKQEKPVADWVTDFVVGEEVIITLAPQQQKRGMKIHRKGKIIKINKKSVSVELFAYNEIDDKNALNNQTYGYNKLVWASFTNDKMVIFARNMLVKRGDNNRTDEEFVEGKRSVDYGN